LARRWSERRRALGGYSAAFYVASVAALACAALTSTFVGEPLPEPT